MRGKCRQRPFFFFAIDTILDSIGLAALTLRCPRRQRRDPGNAWGSKTSQAPCCPGLLNAHRSLQFRNGMWQLLKNNTYASLSVIPKQSPYFTCLQSLYIPGVFKETDEQHQRRFLVNAWLGLIRYPSLQLDI